MAVLVPLRLDIYIALGNVSSGEVVFTQSLNFLPLNITSGPSPILLSSTLDLCVWFIVLSKMARHQLLSSFSDTGEFFLHIEGVRNLYHVDTPPSR